MNNMRAIGPFEVEIKVGIIGEDSEGVATIVMGISEVPTEEKVLKRIARFEQDEMPAGLRLMDKREWFNYIIRQATGGEWMFAIPGKNEWDGVEEER